MKSTKKEKKQYKKAFQEAMARELREHKSSFIVFSILRILVLVVLVRQIMLANYEGAFICILTLLLLYVHGWIQVKLMSHFQSLVLIGVAPTISSYPSRR